MQILKLPLSAVTVGERMRSDYGDLASLAQSIREEGIIHPPVLTRRGSDLVLVAGGRRTAAYALLAEQGHATEFYFNVFEHEVSESQLRMLELRENCERKSMTWQERILNIAEAHRLMTLEKRANAERWSQEMTGRELNVNQALVSHALVLADEIKKKNPVVMEAESYTDAIRALLKQRLDEANAVYIKRLGASPAPAPAIAVEAPETPAEGVALGSEGEGEGESPLSAEPPLKTAFVGTSHLLTPEHIRNLYIHDDCLSAMAKMHDRFNAIVTDPPYGIKMSNLTGDNITRVEDTHDVDENVELLRRFMPLAYNALRANGYLVMWCDIVHFDMLCHEAEAAGFKPVRWPLVWCKTSTCFNNAPQFNPTKATEFVFVARKGLASLPRPLTSNYFLAPNERHATHPFFKPKEVWDYLYKNFCLEGQEVLDPFAGEGSSLVSALCMKLIPTAIEIDSAHINNAIATLPALVTEKKRIENFFEL